MAPSDAWVLLVPFFLAFALIDIGVATWLAITSTLVATAAFVLWVSRLEDPFPVASDITLVVEPSELRRGDPVTLKVTTNAPPNRRLEVGIECIEEFPRDVELPTGGSVEEFIADVCHEAVRQVELPTGSHSFEFRIPATAAFSYTGVNLAYTWHAVAREARAAGPRPEQRTEISVLP